MNLVVLGIVVYVLLQLAIGIVLSRRIASEADYLVAGRSFGYTLGIASTFATWFGAETCIGASGAVYAGGLSSSTADPFGYAACLLLMGIFLAARLRQSNVTTLADHFRDRFSPGIEKVVVILAVPTSVIWAAAQLRAFGQVLAAASGWDLNITISLAACVVVVYTIFGGLYSDAVTDLVQGAAVVAGLIVLLVIVALSDGGLAPAMALVEPDRWHLGNASRSVLESAELWAVPICGSLVAQELIARVIATKTPIVARRSCYAAGMIYLVVGAIPIFLGLVGTHLIPAIDDPEHILPRLAEAYLPGILYVAFVGAIISAILSTVDSCLLAASALATHNLLFPQFPQWSEKRRVVVARAGVAVFGVIALVLATKASSIYHLVEQASAFGSSGVCVVLFLGLYTKFGGPKAAAAGIVSGALVWAVGAFGLHWSAPYVASLGAALFAYVATALVERVLAGAPVAELTAS